jgi:hypothetical protein
MIRGLSDEELQQFTVERHMQTTLWKDGISLKLWADGTMRTDNDDVMFSNQPDILLQPESTIAFHFVLDRIFPWPVFCLVVEYF